MQTIKEMADNGCQTVGLVGQRVGTNTVGKVSWWYDGQIWIDGLGPIDPSTVVPVPWEYIDTGFYKIAESTARQYCSGQLPKHGYEKLVVINDGHFWIMRTVVNGKQVWSVRSAKDWRIRDGIAVLSTLAK